MGEVTGIVLAAGAGNRAGGPKALLSAADGESWISIATRVLLDGGCDRVVVVLGAEAERARALVPAGVTTVVAPRWEAGMSASLRTGLAAATGEAALITLVDLPELPVSVVRRMLSASAPLRQAVFGRRPGHPVFIAAGHWAEVAASVDGDRGARGYLATHDVLEIECGDLWSGEDRDNGAV